MGNKENNSSIMTREDQFIREISRFESVTECFFKIKVLRLVLKKIKLSASQTGKLFHKRED